jgi:hypothetical protein
MDGGGHRDSLASQRYASVSAARSRRRTAVAALLIIVLSRVCPGTEKTQCGGSQARESKAQEPKAQAGSSFNFYEVVNTDIYR